MIDKIPQLAKSMLLKTQLTWADLWYCHCECFSLWHRELSHCSRDNSETSNGIYINSEDDLRMFIIMMSFLHWQPLRSQGWQFPRWQSHIVTIIRYHCLHPIALNSSLSDLSTTTVHLYKCYLLVSLTSPLGVLVRWGRYCGVHLSSRSQSGII